MVSGLSWWDSFLDLDFFPAAIEPHFFFFDRPVAVG
jgi:hypothetical protein